jgi:hypothetical protein
MLLGSAVSGRADNGRHSLPGPKSAAQAGHFFASGGISAAQFGQ